MRRFLIATVFTLLAGATLHAATVNDFYASLLKRGIDHVTAGAYEAGAGELKLAAFGLIDSIELYQTAQVYLAIANQHLDREAQTRAAATRVVAAERIEKHYAKLTLPDALRKEFEAIAQKVLTAAQFAELHVKSS
jgi:predicted metal-dependent phosphoesterase TrpH